VFLRVSCGSVSEEDTPHRWKGHGGLHEAWFLTFTDPASGRGYWIRSSLLGHKEADPSAGVWFAQFDPADPMRTFGIHRRFGFGEVTIKDGIFDVRIGQAVMASGHAAGSVEGGGHQVSWELAYVTGEPTYRLLSDVWYRGRLASTKPYSPNVATTVSGVVQVDGRSADIREATASQGHLYGIRHAERWAWAVCCDYQDEDAVVQALTAQQRRGRFVSPYATFIGVRWGGRWIRLSKTSRQRDFGLGTWKVDVESRRYRLTGRIEAPARALIRARYEDPDGVPRYCHNSEISSSRLALFERRAGGFEEVGLLESRGTTHAEWAGRTPAPQVEREFAEVAR